MAARERHLQWRRVPVASSWLPVVSEQDTEPPKAALFSIPHTLLPQQSISRPQGAEPCLSNPAEYHTPAPTTAGQVIRPVLLLQQEFPETRIYSARLLTAPWMWPLLERETSSRRNNMLILHHRCSENIS